MTLAFCWAHLRRRFYDRAVAEASPIANEALQRIAALYRIEADCRGCDPDKRRAVRQERSRPIVAELEPWLREKLALLSRKSKLAQAIRYGLSHWDGLVRFLDDGRVEIELQHSRAIDQASRPHAQERALRRLGWRRGKLGGHRLADRNVQAKRRRPLRLSRRHTHADRRRSSRQRDRRASPVGLRQGPAAQRRGLRTTLTDKFDRRSNLRLARPPRPGERREAP